MKYKGNIDDAGLSGPTVTVTDCFRFSGTNRSKECMHDSEVERVL